MPRTSEAEKQKNHAKILEAASRLFRENGVDATGVGDVMNAVGMTHGGFYRHFESKEALVEAAFEHAVEDVIDHLDVADTNSALAQQRQAYIEKYLSSQHVSDRGHGCPLATLGAELARTDGTIHTSAAEAVSRLATFLDDSEDDANTKGHSLLALLAGTVLLARLAETEADSEKMLESSRAAMALLQKNWRG